MKRELDGLGKAGAIINIVYAAGFILFGLIYAGMGLILSAVESEAFIFLIFGGIGSIFIILNVFCLIYNIKVLKGQLDKKILAIVFGFINGTILGSIFLLVGKEVELNPYPQPIYQEQDLSETLQSYKSLLDSGTITEEEFIQLKQDLFNKKY